MRPVIAVFKRETALFFRSTIAYAIAFGMLMFLGLIFSSDVAQFNAINQSGFAGRSYTADDVLTFNLGALTFLLFVIAPLLTMRLLSEEAREGTLEVLMTLPMADWQFVLGKFLSVWFFYTVLLGLTLVYVVLLTLVGVPDAGLVFSAYLGAWLYGGAVLAVTMIWSAVTEDQMVAAFLGAATVLVLFLADSISQIVSGQDAIAGLADFIRELSLATHYQGTLLQGVIRGQDIAYFILLMIAALFITTLLVSIRRWRAS